MNSIPLSVLDQSETWTDATGAVHRIADMDASYCRNVIAFLQRRADDIAFVAGLAAMSTRLPDGDTQAYLIVTESLDSKLDRMATEPVAWLNDKPLIKALQQRADKGD